MTSPTHLHRSRSLAALSLWLFAAASAAAPGLFGCGGEGGGKSAPVPLDQFAAKLSQTMCAQNFKCAAATDIDGRSLGMCVDDNSALFSLLVQAISSSQAKGRFSYDAGQMEMCIAGMEAMTCDQWKLGLTRANQPLSCQAALVAKVAINGACQQDAECTTGTCEGSDSSVSPPIDGRCTMLIAEGGSCAGGLSCSNDFTCGPTTQVCVAKRAGGAACTTDSECVNGCNTTTGLCSTYVGCAVAGPPAPTIPMLALSLLVTIAAFGARPRPRRRTNGAARPGLRTTDPVPM